MQSAATISMTQAPSAKWIPVKIVRRGVFHASIGTYSEWENDRYHGTVRIIDEGPLAGGIVIGITANDQTALHDWRDFQNIKNDLAGREWEAVELYPAESRLRDPSNRFYLWCTENKFGFGNDTRLVCSPDDAPATQRPFPAGDRPWLITQFPDKPGLYTANLDAK